MDECEHLCPLCCEELDLSDREFYPCKCGYQVCMWCWHRIRETESGLCPACRTPYGEDPHLFTAVDVEEVLKANKEKEAAAKRERERQRQLQDDGGGGGAEHAGGGPGHHPHLSNSEISIEAPKDRSSLANMRVIRRNLVYAVGLPPNIATEETLRKPEYFGQYGKVSKIVINRSQVNVPGTDPRRASASAYVTFAHKEDTLACILAVDGFHIDNRNIRASYGTSKYCSSFIKNVRCNNPECTYLHEMGLQEDTFTKQEIQAGYATSGSTVLRSTARALPRKKVGGGGPSGTGKIAQNPVFPAPEFEEAPRATSLVPPPPPAVSQLQRATTMAAGPAAAAGMVPAQAAAVLGAAGQKMGRSASVGSRSPTLPSINAQPAGVATTTIAAAANAARKPAAAPVSAASVVAGVHSVSAKTESSAQHSTLTPLTPLKRHKAPKPVAGSAPPQPVPPPEEKLLRANNNTKKKNGGSAAAAAAVASTNLAPSQPGAPPTQTTTANGNAVSGPSSIGGDVIGPPLPRRTSGGIAGLGGEPLGPDLSAIGGGHDGGAPGIVSAGSSGSGGLAPSSAFLGGEVFTGMLSSSNSNSSTAIGSGKDKWNSSPTHLDGTGDVGNGYNGGSTLWDNPAHAAPGQNFNHGPGSGVIGSHTSGGSGVAPSATNSSSALASILGINLPTGSGSLSGSVQESNLWSSAAPEPMTSSLPSPLSALNEGAMSMHGGGVTGGGSPNYGGGSSLIGGVPIGGGSGSGALNNPGPIGGGGGGGGGQRSDIALLQSLLPGVHITSGTENLGFNNGGHGVGSGPPTVTPSSIGLGPSGLNGDAIGNNWNGGGGGAMPTAATGSPMGAIGRSNAQQNRRGQGIW